MAYQKLLAAHKQDSVYGARCTQAFLEKRAADNPEIVDYHFEDYIGKGPYGRVYKALDLVTNQHVAVKVITVGDGDNLDRGDVETLDRVRQEILTNTSLKNRKGHLINNIVDHFIIANSVCIITDYSNGPSVSDLMRPLGYLEERCLRPIIREVSNALLWIHGQGVTHHNIKCRNVLISDQGRVRLTDFGMPSVLEARYGRRNTYNGKLHWVAPEMFDKGAKLGPQVDIWGLGILAYEAALGERAKCTIRWPYQLGDHTCQTCPSLQGERFSAALKDFVSSCLVVAQHKRPTIEGIRMHRYLTGSTHRNNMDTLRECIQEYQSWQADDRSKTLRGSDIRIDSVGLGDLEERMESEPLMFPMSGCNTPDPRATPRCRTPIPLHSGTTGEARLYDSTFLAGPIKLSTLTIDSTDIIARHVFVSFHDQQVSRSPLATDEDTSSAPFQSAGQDVDDDADESDVDMMSALSDVGATREESQGLDFPTSNPHKRPIDFISSVTHKYTVGRRHHVEPFVSHEGDMAPRTDNGLTSNLFKNRHGESFPKSIIDRQIHMRSLHPTPASTRQPTRPILHGTGSAEHGTGPLTSFSTCPALGDSTLSIADPKTLGREAAVGETDVTDTQLEQNSQSSSSTGFAYIPSHLYPLWWQPTMKPFTPPNLRGFTRDPCSHSEVDEIFEVMDEQLNQAFYNLLRNAEWGSEKSPK